MLKISKKAPSAPILGPKWAPPEEILGSRPPEISDGYWEGGRKITKNPALHPPLICDLLTKKMKSPFDI